MTNLTAELADLSHREVPVINHRFTVSPHAAARLWSEGVALPVEGDYPPDYYPSPGRVLRSGDGRWLLRRQAATLPTDLLDIHETVAKAAAEFEQLQGHGVNVISRAITTSPMAETIITISPWVPDLTLCNDATYEAAIAPRVGQYLKRSVGGIALYDISRSHQFASCAATEGEPFLHDADPELDLIAT